jgi:hypothetical protein
MTQAWKNFAKATHKIETQYAPLFYKINVNYRSSLITDIHTYGITQARNNLAGNAVILPVAPLLQSLYKKAGLMGAKMQYTELKQAVRQGKKPKSQKAGVLPEMSYKAGFGINEQWIADVLNYLKINLLNLAQNISETMRSDALKIFNEGVADGWSVDQMVKALKETGLMQRRARVIARTETVRAANVGHQIGAKSLPYEMNKKWIAAKDHRTRHSHKQVNGQVTDEQATFKVPVYKGLKPTGAFDNMQAPGDPTASAANTINCRCRVIYEPKLDEQGEYIPRSRHTATIIPLRSVQPLPASQIAAALAKELKAAIRIGVQP